MIRIVIASTLFAWFIIIQEEQNLARWKPGRVYELHPEIYRVLRKYLDGQLFFPFVCLMFEVKIF